MRPLLFDFLAIEAFRLASAFIRRPDGPYRLAVIAFDDTASFETRHADADYAAISCDAPLTPASFRPLDEERLPGMAARRQLA